MLFSNKIFIGQTVTVITLRITGMCHTPVEYADPVYFIFEWYLSLFSEHLPSSKLMDHYVKVAAQIGSSAPSLRPDCWVDKKFIFDYSVCVHFTSPACFINEGW